MQNSLRRLTGSTAAGGTRQAGVSVEVLANSSKRLTLATLPTTRAGSLSSSGTCGPSSSSASTPNLRPSAVGAQRSLRKVEDGGRNSLAFERVKRLRAQALSRSVPKPLAIDVVDGGKLRLLKVQPITLKRYNDAVAVFIAWALSLSFALSCDRKVDQAMVRYLEMLFSDARHPVEGRYALHGYIFTHPVQHTVAKLRLPLAREALVGWVSRIPGRMRDPAPEHVIWLICLTFLDMNMVAAALASAIIFDGYFRPSEVLDLDWRSVARGRGAWAVVVGNSELGEVTKTKQQDDTVILGIGNRGWVVNAFRAWHSARGAPDSGRVFPLLTLAKLESLFRTATKKLGIAKFNVTPHVLRHSGPSNDVLQRRVTLPEVKKRGRWACDRSVARYEKSGRLLLKVQQMSAVLERLASAAAARLPTALLAAIEKM